MRKRHVKEVRGIIPPETTTHVIGGSDMQNIVIGGDELLRPRRERERKEEIEAITRYFEANPEGPRKAIAALRSKEARF